MKRTVRMVILMVGLVGTFVSAAVPQVAAPDGGPIPVRAKCQTTTAPDGGPIPVRAK